MTRSVSFPRLTAANVPVLNPRSVFVVFINEVTNASRRVITWPRDPRVSFFSSRTNTRAKRQKKKNKKRNTRRKRKQGRKKERKQARRSGHPRRIIHRGGHSPWNPAYKTGEEIAWWQGRRVARVARCQGHRGSLRAFLQGDTVGTFV